MTPTDFTARALRAVTEWAEEARLHPSEDAMHNLRVAIEQAYVWGASSADIAAAQREETPCQ